jgi:hypothetical protein
MSLAAIGDGASYEFRWRTWALLRDVVVANLDEESIPAFASIGDAMVEGTLRLDAAALLVDIERIREWLVGRSFDELVLGPRTSALLHPSDARWRARRSNACVRSRIHRIWRTTSV